MPPFDAYGPPPMMGRPPFGGPPRGFAGPMLRGLFTKRFLSFLTSLKRAVGRGRPPFQGDFYPGEFPGKSVDD